MKSSREAICDSDNRSKNLKIPLVISRPRHYNLKYSERIETLLPEAYSEFIEKWGSMGVLWGINRSMARIHAFIIVSEKPVDLDTVATELKISRGNASMSLKELRSWGVIERVHIAGDRRDFYIAEPDTWKMLFKIVVERKKREFDPALDALRHLLTEADIEKREDVHRRLTDLEQMLATLDRIMEKFFGNEKVGRAMLDLLSSPKA
jgi:DNA-binding transcriptional regulator GbsR (MarR family)